MARKYAKKAYKPRYKPARRSKPKPKKKSVKRSFSTKQLATYVNLVKAKRGIQDDSEE